MRLILATLIVLFGLTTYAQAQDATDKSAKIAQLKTDASAWLQGLKEKASASAPTEAQIDQLKTDASTWLNGIKDKMSASGNSASTFPAFDGLAALKNSKIGEAISVVKESYQNNDTVQEVMDKLVNLNNSTDKEKASEFFDKMSANQDEFFDQLNTVLKNVTQMLSELRDISTDRTQTLRDMAEKLGALHTTYGENTTRAFQALVMSQLPANLRSLLGNFGGASSFGGVSPSAGFGSFGGPQVAPMPLTLTKDYRPDISSFSRPLSQDGETYSIQIQPLKAVDDSETTSDVQVNKTNKKNNNKNKKNQNKKNQNQKKKQNNKKKQAELATADYQ